MELRSFQREIIDQIEAYLSDKTIHVVAPPGAGKTVLGIEILKELKKRTLILVPSLVLKNQWLKYLAEAFGKQNVSQRLSDRKELTITTYQEFHLYYESLSADSYAFIILDEAHHLKRTWAEEIISFREKNQTLQSLSLTATPPYDAAVNEWKRYIELNGAVDIELPSTQLIKEGVLVPYQDYVHFIPESEENERAFSDYLQRQDQIVRSIMNDDEVTNYLLSLAYIQNPLEFSAFIYEHFDLYLSMLLYLYEQDWELSNEHWEVLGLKKYRKKVQLPNQTKENLGCLYQFLFEEHAELSIFHYLAKNNWIIQNKLALFPSYRDDKKHSSVPLKKESIAEILLKEEACLKEQLCSVIFMDRIKLETLFGQDPYLEFGVAPVFIYLKDLIRPATNLAAVCGKFCLVTYKLAQELFPEVNLTILEMDSAYAYISLTEENRSQVLTAITQALNQNKINILVGTVSFLGEGWDCPAINTVVLANVSGSYVQTQQLRGRGLRKAPEKHFCNIWHITTIYKNIDLKEQTEFQHVAKRLSFIEGLNRLEQVRRISTGIERFELPGEFTEESINRYNFDNFYHSQKREALQKEWLQAAALGTHQAMPLLMKPSAEQAKFGSGIAERNVQTVNNFYRHIFSLSFFRKLRIRRSWKRYCKQLEQIIRSIFMILKEDTLLPEESRLVIQKDETVFTCKLENVSFNANTLFNQQISEVMCDIDNPRYLLNVNHVYFSVPGYFNKNKKDVLRLAASIEAASGKVSVCYTRNTEGRQALMEAYIRQSSREVVEEKIWE